MYVKYSLLIFLQNFNLVHSTTIIVNPAVLLKFFRTVLFRKQLESGVSESPIRRFTIVMTVTLGFPSR